MKRIIVIFLIFSFVILRPSTSRAAIDPKQQISIILFSGLGGAILGLSTLSFYDQPQNHLRNIAVGGAVALIGSVIFTTVYAAKQSKAEAENLDEGPAGPNQPRDVKEEKAKKKSEKKKKDQGGQGASDQENGTGDEEPSGEEGAILDITNPKDDIKFKVLLAGYSGSKLSFDPNFLYISPGMAGPRGEKGLNFYGRVLEINF